MPQNLDFSRCRLADCENLSRRTFLGFSTAFAASMLMPYRSSLAGMRDPRFLFVILRGALDGISAVMPVGDPDFAKVREGFMDDVRQAGAPLPLDSMFALNPAMKTLAELYARKQATLVHAVCTPYRDRSHFDGQEVLESGLPNVTHGDSGWLNRALAGLPVSAATPKDRQGLAVGPTVPLVLRGDLPVMSWSPEHLRQSTPDTIARLLSLYQARDPALAEALQQAGTIAKETQMNAAMAGNGSKPAVMMTGDMRMASSVPTPPARGLDAMLAVADGAARLLVRPDGPRIAALSIDGWDTHADEKPGTGRLGKLLGLLDQLFDHLHKGLEPVWNDTVIVAATEFGRTVHINGTAGTDHGTGTIAFLLGGAIKGGQVIADWPGLADKSLLDGRDLKPTTDLRAVLKPVLTDHLGLDPRLINARVFPDSVAVAGLRNLLG